MFALHYLPPYRAKDDDAGTPEPDEADDAAPEGDDAKEAPETLEDAVLSSLEGVAEEEPARAKADEDEDEDEDGKTPGPEAPAKAAEAAGKDGAPQPKGGAEPPEDELYQVPKGLSERAAERYRKLVDRAKQRDQDARETGQQLEQFVTMVRETGASPEQFNTALTYISAVHSDDPQRLQAARQVLQSELAAIDRRLGVPPSADDQAQDLLGRHQDLAQAVENMDISREMAVKLAAEREATREEVSRRRQRDQQAEQSARHQQEISQAAADVAALERDLQSRDPNYGAKRPFLERRAAEVARTYPPHLWRERLAAAHQEITELMAASAPAPRRGQQPLRPGSSGHAGAAAPKDMEGVVMQTLGIE